MRPRAVVGTAAAVAVILGAALWFIDVRPTPMTRLLASVGDESNLDDRHTQIDFIDATEWVEIYRPDEASSGFNLVLYRRRVPMIIDMNGNVVHVWPRVRASGRIRLDRRGRLAVIGTDDVVKEYDWDGRLTWAYRMPGKDHLPHHDLIRIANGNYLVLGRVKTGRIDYLHEVDRSGKVVWEWTADDRVIDAFPDAVIDVEDRTHINSVQELPPNRWFDGRDPRFRPGNILVSARNLNGILIVDRRTGDVVWTYDRGLDYQHEAAMIPKGQLGEGLILVFDNGYKNRVAYRRSRIVAIDPIDGVEVWSYHAPDFFSSVAGAQQPLPNGNVLITSSQGGRVFEVTPRGSVVWQWIPPFEPMRAARVAYDHCPQLARLPRPDERPVNLSDRPRWIDLELHQFTLPEEHRVREVYGERRQLLPQPNGCREFLMPSTPVLRFGHGFDPDVVEDVALRAGFFVTLTGSAGGPFTRVYEEWLDTSRGDQWRDVKIPVHEYGDQRLVLCVRTETDGPAGSGHAVLWENPTVRCAARSELRDQWRKRSESRQERTLEQRQLEAIGYVQ